MIRYHDDDEDERHGWLWDLLIAALGWLALVLGMSGGERLRLW